MKIYLDHQNYIVEILCPTQDSTTTTKAASGSGGGSSISSPNPPNVGSVNLQPDGEGTPTPAGAYCDFCLGIGI